MKIVCQKERRCARDMKIDSAEGVEAEMMLVFTVDSGKACLSNITTHGSSVMLSKSFPIGARGAERDHLSFFENGSIQTEPKE